MDRFRIALQLFADGGDGGAAAGAEGATGVQSPAAGENPPQKRRKENPLANVKYGMQPEGKRADGQSAAGNESAAEGQAKPSFEDLIKGEYKEEFGQRVQSIIQQRFKDNGENERKLAAMNPLLEMLGRKYNVDPTDVDKLTQIVGDDDSLYEEEAMQRGMSVESLKAVKKLERENEQLKAQEEQSQQEMMMRQHFDALAKQADEARQLYPALDLMQEMQNPMFARLTAPGVGVDVRTAYEVVHRDEMRGAEMQYAAQRSAERMANAVRSNTARPVENGLSSQQQNVVVKSDPRMLTKADRAEIRERVRRGEKIAF